MFSKRRWDREFAEEIESHLQMHIEDLIRSGMTAGEARRQARIRFGGVESVRASYRDRRSLPLLESLLQDLAYGLRMLRRNPGFTAAAVLTLALGIGANTAVFSVINAVLVRPLPYPESDRLVILYNSYMKIGPDLTKYGYCCNSAPDYFDRKEEKEVFESLTVFDFESYSLGSGESLRRVTGLRVTPSFFTVLETPPRLGRGFTEAEAEPGGERVAILSHGLWETMYAGSISVPGDSIRINGVPHEIIGVMPKGFDVFSRKPELFVPLVFTERQKANHHSNFAFMLARLRPGVTAEMAEERMDAIDAGNLEQIPWMQEFVERTGFATVVRGVHDELVQTVKLPLYLLQVGVAFVLLIGCVNIANLLLVRSAGRQQELAIRFALGAGRWRVTLMLLTESLLLALIGGVAGLLIGIGGMPALAWLGAEKLPRAGGINIDMTVVVFTMMTVILTGLICGVIPAMHVSKKKLGEMLHQGARAGSSGRSASVTRGVLAVAEVSLALVLLNGAFLMVASFTQVLSVDPGFNPKKVLTARLSLPDSRYPNDQEVRTFAERVQEAVGSLHGVRSAGITTLLPFSIDMNRSIVTVEGYDPGPEGSTPTPHNSWVTGGFFTAMGIPLLKGRLFDARDRGDAPLVAVVDKEFADRYWPGGSPIGKRIHRGGKGTWMSIVGVVGTIKVDDLGALDRRGTVYFSQIQWAGEGYTPLRRDMSLVVRAAASEALPGDAIRTAILELDHELPIHDIKTMEVRLADSLLMRRVPMTLLLIFASVALLLSAIGVYSVLAHSVKQRTRDIGIQMALGAAPSRILKQVLWQGSKLVLLGLVTGLGGALWSMELIAGLLYGVEPTEPSVFALAAAVLAAVAVTACWLPSRRATRVNVVSALRCE
jgi:predicted permease